METAVDSLLYSPSLFSLLTRHDVEESFFPGIHLTDRGDQDRGKYCVLDWYTRITMPCLASAKPTHSLHKFFARWMDGWGRWSIFTSVWEQQEERKKRETLVVLVCNTDNDMCWMSDVALFFLVCILFFWCYSGPLVEAIKNIHV